MARSDIVTLLSLDRYSRILGINPSHFNSAAGSDVMPATGACSDVWMQYSWQLGDRVARRDLAQAIDNAEYEIAHLLGYYPGPKFIVNEVHEYPRHYRRHVVNSGANIRGFEKSIVTKFGRVIDTGQRALGTKIDVVPVFSSEQTPAGYDETVTVTAAHGGVTDTREWKVFVADKDGAEEWEIRDPRTVNIVGANVVFTFWAWQFINPDLWEALTETSEGIATLNLADAIYLADCDVYRVFLDHTLTSAQFYWEPENWLISAISCQNCGGTGCVTCQLTTQDGCAHIRDVDAGIVVPNASTYDSDEEQWVTASWTDCRTPDQVKLWYQAGELDQAYLDERSVEPLSLFWAETIAWLATARLERNFCACANLTALTNSLRQDVTRTDPNGPSFFIDESELKNPLGVRKGEIMAWRRISKVANVRAKVAVI